MHRFALLLPLLAACGEESIDEAASETCHTICDVLVSECAYDAYPQYTSCLEGCTWEESEGVDVEAELACFEAAACDTFAVIECANQYGIQEP